MVARLLLPKMVRFTEYRISWVKIPARIAGIPNAVWKSPVTTPVNTPARNAINTAGITGHPPAISTAQTQPPVQIEPSTVKSAMSSIL